MKFIQAGREIGVGKTGYQGMEEVVWKLNYRGQALSGQIGVRRGKRKCSGLRGS